MADAGGVGARRDQEAKIAGLASSGGVLRRRRVLQTNSAGDNIHVIDPATNQTVGMIEDIEVPHGVVDRAGRRRAST